MGRRVTVAVLAIAASLALASSAGADSYQVLGTADAASGPGCTQTQPTLWSCPTLRQAVLDANARVGEDQIGPLAGTYTLTFGQLSLADNVTLVGSGARSTTITAGNASRVLSIAGGATVNVVGLTIADGTVNSGAGGNIEVGQGANLAMLLSRVTHGRANQGGGIMNAGTVTLGYSLLDDNSAQAAGGAIFNDGGLSNAVTAQVSDSTLANNYASEGAGIYSAGNAQNQILLSHATIARNLGAGGLSFDGQQNVTIYGSIVADNASGDCRGGGASPFSGRTSVESGTSCGLTDPTNRQGTDSGIAAALSNQGGETDVLTIPAGSAAVDLDTPCVSAQDQRGAARAPGGTCDAGAFEQGGTGTQPPPVQTPVPTPVVPTPTPVPNQIVVGREVSGTVKIKLKGTNKFVDFDATKGIPVGSEIDTRKGRLELEAIPKPGAPPQKAVFYDGIFIVTQRAGITSLTLSEPLAACPKRGRAAAAAAKPKKRKLWGDGRGAFRTVGKYSAATVRGTRWLVEDSCAGTRTTVAVGTVYVRDNVKKKTFVVRKSKPYLAKPK